MNISREVYINVLVDIADVSILYVTNGKRAGMILKQRGLPKDGATDGQSDSSISHHHL